MTGRGDEALRAAERALDREDTPETWATWVAAWERAGRPGRDPRREPRPGDVLRVEGEVRAVRRAGHELLRGRYEQLPGQRARRRLVHTEVVVYVRLKSAATGRLVPSSGSRTCSLTW